MSIAKSVAQAYALEQDQNAWESFRPRLDKAVEEAQESDEDASTLALTRLEDRSRR